MDMYMPTNIKQERKQMFLGGGGVSGFSDVRFVIS